MTICVPDPAALLGLVLRSPIQFVIVVLVLVVVATALTAVWSRRPARRCAAATTLDRMLTAVERLASSTSSSA
jgi:hypothetical protein